MAKIRGCVNPQGELLGYSLYCPGCKHRHVVYVSGPVRWDFNGNMDKPTFKPSLLINKFGELHVPELPVCHSYITDGKIQFLSDCTHELAGQTIELPNI